MLNAASAMGLEPEDPRLSAAWQVWHALDAQAALGAPSIEGAAAQLCTPEGIASSGGEVELSSLGRSSPREISLGRSSPPAQPEHETQGAGCTLDQEAATATPTPPTATP